MRPPSQPASPGLAAALRGVVADLQRASGAEMVSIYLYEEAARRFYAPFAIGQPEESLLGALADMDEQLGRYLADAEEGKVPDELVLGPLCDAREIGGEGRVAALVPGHLGSVDEHLGPVVDGAEVEQEPLRRRGGEAAPVPEAVPGGSLADPGELGLGAEGHVDPALETGQLPGAELPLAVQVGPLPALQPWPRVIGSGLWQGGNL